MSDDPNIHAFPANKLGDFLRAMADPEGTGELDAERERDIARIEERVAAAMGSAPDSSDPEAPAGH